MSKSTPFSPGDSFANFVEGQIAEVQCSSVGDVVRAGLRSLEEWEAWLATLRAALVEGENSGPSVPFDFEAFIGRKRGTE